eukprot:CAMPEP_0197578200 /NCGR_PEP_ID=MMETSP1326-20131121/2523_1 /TAXON_ID=1155430 /ORGANISM="Genus nov. species nov., Strain RCC2288" /LENGTH=148 /DNA_ID=CAMNT_0043141365 /DNA_START=112 /DNA_END=555 /DNA_ORIENTATION=+
MLMPKAHRIAIYTTLFKDGALAVKKDVHKESHDQITAVPNLHVLKEMQSLTSRGYVRHTYSWRWNYYFLTDEGIDFLRKYLHLPAEIAPDTLLKPAAGAAFPGAPGGRGDGMGRGRGGFDKGPREGGYRREGGAGGFGRGAGGRGFGG